MSNPAQFQADLKDLSDKAEVDYGAISAKMVNGLRKCLEIRIAVGNLEYELKTAMMKFDEQLKTIESNYSR